ncbi:hypothetical protein ACHAXS_008521 [Conticribra weissflogii]
MLRRKSSGSRSTRNLLASPQDEDPEDSRREYNACVQEIKQELGLVSSLALHQEAMKRLGEKQKAKHKVEQQQLQQHHQQQQSQFKQTKMRRQSSIDAVARLFSMKLHDAIDKDDDSLSGMMNDDRSFSGMGGFKRDQSISNLFLGDEIDVPTVQPSAGGGSIVSDPARRKSGGMASRMSMNSFGLLFRETVAGQNEEQQQLAQKVLRRRSSVVSSLDHDDDYLPDNRRRELELSDSDNESDESDGRLPPTMTVGPRRNSLARSSFSRASGGQRSSTTKQSQASLNSHRRGSMSGRSEGSNTAFNSSEYSFDSEVRREFSGGVDDSNDGKLAGYWRGVEEKKFESSNGPSTHFTGGRPACKEESSRPVRRGSSLASFNEGDSNKVSAVSRKNHVDPGKAGESLICGWGSQNSMLSQSERETTQRNDGDDLLCGWENDSQVSTANDPWRCYEANNHPPTVAKKVPKKQPAPKRGLFMGIDFDLSSELVRKKS